jgi:hypothetical protein
LQEFGSSNKLRNSPEFTETLYSQQSPEFPRIIPEFFGMAIPELYVISVKRQSQISENIRNFRTVPQFLIRKKSGEHRNFRVNPELAFKIRESFGIEKEFNFRIFLS